MVSRSLFVGAMLVSASCSRYNPVSITFFELPSRESDLLVPHGFMCNVEGGDQTMAAKASAAAETADLDALEACVVTDLVWWQHGDIPDGCRAAQLIDFCVANECGPKRRVTKTVSVPNDGTFAQRVRGALQDLSGSDTEIWDAPDIPLIVRVFATFQPCDDLEQDGAAIPAHLPEFLFGCANSCPVRLDDVRGDLLLDLDTMDPNCERSVRICASDRFVEEE